MMSSDGVMQYVGLRQPYPIPPPTCPANLPPSSISFFRFLLMPLLILTTSPQITPLPEVRVIYNHFHTG